MGGFGAVFLLNMIGESGAKVPIVVKGGVQSDNNVENMDAEKNNLVVSTWCNPFRSLPLPRLNLAQPLIRLVLPVLMLIST